MSNRLIPLSEAERAMKVQEVIIKAMAKEITWLQAADIIGTSPRQLRRWRQNYQEYGYDGLLDRRKSQPSPRKIPMDVAEKVLQLYREQYKGYNVSHFHEEITRDHDVEASYSWTKSLLQAAGLVAKSKSRGTYRRRRPRKACTGMLLHIDGSEHRWFRHPRDERQCLIVLLDDATSEILYAKFEPQETTKACLDGIFHVVQAHGTFASLYTDRASHFVYTPKAGKKPDRSKKTHLEQVLDALGIELICAYSPEARGRSERMFGTLQGRLVNELKRASISSYEAANDYLQKVYLPRHNKRFSVAAQEPISAFLPTVGINLPRIFARRHSRKVNRDNTIDFESTTYQLPKERHLATLAGRKVEVRKHLCGKIEVLSSQRLIAEFQGQWTENDDQNYDLEAS
jgi:transposase